MTKITLNFISDPGHGWLEVPIPVFKASGAVASRYSYYSEKRNCVYLEEDWDAFLFMEAVKGTLEITVTDEHIEHDCFVRRCQNMPEAL